MSTEPAHVEPACDVTIPAATAQAALAALEADPSAAEHALVLRRVLHPAPVWVLHSGTDRYGYPLHLGCCQYDLRAGNPVDYEFAGAADAHLFTQADKDSFDADAFAAAHHIDDEDTLADLHAAEWAPAPSKADALDAYDSGSTELDYCEALSALANRAQALRDTL